MPDDRLASTSTCCSRRWGIWPPLLLWVVLLTSLTGCAGGDRGVAGDRTAGGAAGGPSPAQLLVEHAAPGAVPATAPTVAPPAPAAAQVTLSVEQGAAPAVLVQRLIREIRQAGYLAVVVGPDQAADVILGYDPPDEYYRWPLTPTQFIPVVSFWLPITEVTYTDLERIFRQEVGDWSELGSPRAVEIVPLALQTTPQSPLLASSPLSDVDDLVAVLEQSPGGIALIPLEQMDPRLRSLQVDGRDLIQEEEIVPGDPLVRVLVLAAAPTVPQAVVERVADMAAAQRLASPLPAIEIVVVGDVVPGRGVRALVEYYGGDYTRPFARVARWLSGADLTLVNLEGVLSDDIPPPSDPHTFFFVASGQFCDGLLYAGVDVVSLANNHSMNFGRSGLEDTMALLEQANIAYFGAGMNLEEARQPAQFEIEGITFAFLGFDGVSHELYGAGEDHAGTAPAYSDLVMADIAALDEQVDVIIPYFHWGPEYTRMPSEWQVRLGHEAVEAGADLVLGNHPHWVQGVERYQGVPILYSLGNFVFDQMWSLETRQGVIARLIFRGSRLVGIRFQAVLIEDRHQPRLLPIQQADEIYQAMEMASPRWPQPEEGASP